MAELHRKTKVILLLIAALALATTLYAIFLFIKSSGPLRGELTYDFGTIAIPSGSEVVVEHTFELTNTSQRELTIVSAKPDCGCTSAEPDRKTISPGQEVKIRTTLSLTRAGAKSSMVYLKFDDDRMQILRLRANGRMPPALTAARAAVSVDAGQSTKLEIFLRVFGTDAEPVALSVRTPEHVSVQIDSWVNRFRPRNPAMAPTEWEALVTITRDDQPLSADAVLECSYPEAAKLTIPINHAAGETEQPSSQHPREFFQRGTPPATAPGAR
jgi:hypothetical protein